MIETLKKLDKKFLIIAGCLIILPILLIIFLAIIQGCSNRKTSYNSYENKMVTAAKKYFNDNDLLPKNESETSSVTLDTLIDRKYIKTTEKLLDETCSGSVTVRNNGSSIESNNGGFLNYTYDLKCEKYSTVHLIDKLKESITTEGSGLYLVGEDYIFKGDTPKNYITFYDKNYRIMSIDKDGIIKLIRDESEINSKVWDNKYNTEAKASYGKTIYKDSAILKTLISDYQNKKKISPKAKEHIVAYDSCIGKRNSKDYSINKELDCSEVLEKQVISLVNVSDYAMASLDPECDSIASKSCRNYNYLSSKSLSTWTLNSILDNTYETIYLSSGYYRIENASMYNTYNIVIYIDGNELYTTGIGTSENPYVIK